MADPGDIPDDPPALREEAAIALFRIVQESLTNASKYAHARHVEIAMHRHGELLTLVVRDDGRGLPEDFEGAPPLATMACSAWNSAWRHWAATCAWSRRRVPGSASGWRCR